jgi:hypothetical protein
MPRDEQPSAKRDPARTLDAARVLPIIGVFLLMPPVIALFAGFADVGGVPLVVVSLFGVRLALIVCAALLARRLAPMHDRDPGGPDAP